MLHPFEKERQKSQRNKNFTSKTCHTSAPRYFGSGFWIEPTKTIAATKAQYHSTGSNNRPDLMWRDHQHSPTVSTKKCLVWPDSVVMLCQVIGCGHWMGLHRCFFFFVFCSVLLIWPKVEPGSANINSCSRMGLIPSTNTSFTSLEKFRADGQRFCATQPFNTLTYLDHEKVYCGSSFLWHLRIPFISACSCRLRPGAKVGSLSDWQPATLPSAKQSGRLGYWKQSKYVLEFKKTFPRANVPVLQYIKTSPSQLVQNGHPLWLRWIRRASWTQSFDGILPYNPTMKYNEPKLIKSLVLCCPQPAVIRLGNNQRVLHRWFSCHWSQSYRAKSAVTHSTERLTCLQTNQWLQQLQ